MDAIFLQISSVKVLSFLMLTILVSPSISSFFPDNQSSVDANAEIANTVINPDEEPDTSSTSLNQICWNWRTGIRACFNLLDAAESHGFTAFPAEIKERLALYGILFPGLAFSDKEISKELTIEKYLFEQKNIAPSPLQTESVYNELSEYYPGTLPDQTISYPILRCKALFSMDTVVSMRNELNYKLFKEKQRHNSNRVWPVEKLKINEDPNRCIVTDPFDGSCIVTVDEYNTFALIRPLYRHLSFDTARFKLLDDLLKQLYFNNLVNSNRQQYGKKILNSQKDQIEINLLKKRLTYNTKYEEQWYRETYSRYYNRFFCSRLIQTVALVGSTDSLFIDSLYVIIEQIEDDSIHARSSLKFQRLKALPWVTASSDILPDTIVKSISSTKFLHYRKCKTPFGFFIVRILKNERIYETPFEDAHDKISYLIQEEKSLYGRKPDSVHAVDFYRRNIDKFRTPDTILLRAWLLPPFDSIAFKSLSNEEQQIKISNDTSSFLAIHLSSLDLPAMISDKLAGSLDGNTYENKDAFIGPVFSDLGTWYFSIQNFTPGGQCIPFVLAKDSIISEMEVQVLPLKQITETSTGRRLLEREAVSMAYQANLPKEIQAISDDKILELIDNKAIVPEFDSPTALNNSKNMRTKKNLLNLARFKILTETIERNEKEFKQWCNTLFTDKSLLFTGHTRSNND